MNPHGVWFTADTHFGHEKILDHDGSWQNRARPGLPESYRTFKTIEAHDEAVIEAWNDVVRPNDTVYHLGDFAFRCSKPVHEYRRRLNGNIVLIPGNHDPGFAVGRQGLWQNFGHNEEWPKDEVRNELTTVKVLGQRIVLCHYPLLRWEDSHKGSWHLFGHVHGCVPGQPGSLDVGINVWGRPISYGEVAWHLRDFRALPHHPSADSIPEMKLDNPDEIILTKPEEDLAKTVEELRQRIKPGMLIERHAVKVHECCGCSCHVCDGGHNFNVPMIHTAGCVDRFFQRQSEMTR